MCRGNVITVWFRASVLVAIGVGARGALSQTVFRVDGASGNASGDGSGWGVLAFKYLQDALAAAVPVAAEGQTVQVWIAQGSYRPDQDKNSPSGTGNENATFAYSSRVEVYGGFAGTETLLSERDPANHVVTLTGAPSWAIRVVTIANADASPRLDGVTVTGGGNALVGPAGGIRINNASPTIYGVAVLNNYGGYSRPAGAGIFVSGGSPLIDHCLFDSNTAGQYPTYGFGGAIYDGGSAIVSNCTFTRNKAGSNGVDGGGGAIWGNGSSTVLSSAFINNSTLFGKGGAICGAGAISGCAFTTNAATDGEGGAVYGAASIADCIFSNNLAVNGGGVRSCSSISDCTFSSNRGTYPGDPIGMGGAGFASGPFVRCTFAGNSSDFRGGAIVGGSAVDCVFSGNSSSAHKPNSGGGAIWGGSAVNCTFLNNSAGEGAGGAIFGGSAENCAFANNVAMYGGAIHSAGIVRGCMFTRNTAANHPPNPPDGSGGAGYASGPFIECSFYGNTAQYRGGALYLSSATNCKFGTNGTDSVALPNGGGGGMYGGAAVNCVFTSNSCGTLAGSGGGAMSACDGATNCTFYANTGSAVMGGGAFANSIFWNNKYLGVADESGQARAGSGAFTFDHCFVQGWTAEYGGEGNFGGALDADPCFVDADGADNTSGTADDDLRLCLGSPCIDAGVNSLLPNDTYDLDENGVTNEPIPYDVLGAPRFFDDPWTIDWGVGSAPIIDLGACEYHCPSDYDGDGWVNGIDFDSFVAAFEAGEVSADFDHNTFVNGEDFDAFVGAFQAGC